jgi:alpha/beta superfamily hydrolase
MTVTSAVEALSQPTAAPDHDAATTDDAAPIYFGPGDRLFGWYHPAAEDARRTCGVILCPPLGYEELCTHRALRHWARALARAGIPTLRLDYDGTGNSAGCDTDASRVAAWIASIIQAAAELRALSGVTNIVLAGTRVGGTLAMAAAPQAAADALVLFAPCASGRAYAREVFALGRMMGGRNEQSADETRASDVEQSAGFTLTRETIADLSALDPVVQVAGVRRALLIPRDDVPTETTLAERLAARGLDVDRVVLPGYAAMMVDAHESLPPHAVIDGCVRWLTSHYALSGAGSPAAALTTRPALRAASAVDGPTEDGVRESAVIFDGERRLFGVLSENVAHGEQCGTGIILANAGSVHTVGPGRLHVELARGWARLGFTVLRMDMGGVGDSETRADSADNHPYPHHAVQDLATAARWMVDRVGVRRVVVAGLCSGAHASFHAGLGVHGIAGIIVVNPIVFYWDETCALDVAAWMTYYESRRYSRSVREVAAWVRLVRGEVNVRHAAVVGYRRMREVVGGAAAGLWRRFAWHRVEGDDVPTDLERISARGVDVLLVFSEGDPGLDFVRRRHAHEIRVLERRRSNFAMRVVAGADHTFTRREARERLAHLLTTHLVERHRR